MIEDNFDDLVNNIQLQIDIEEEKEFSAKVIREYRNPHNVGRIQEPNCIGIILGPCGDTMEFSIIISKDRIQRILFMTDGCGPSIACGSMTTKLARDKTIEEAFHILDTDILNALDGLPDKNKHCAKLAADTLHAAIKKFWKENP